MEEVEEAWDLALTESFAGAEEDEDEEDVGL